MGLGKDKSSEDFIKSIFIMKCQIETGHTATINCVRFNPTGKWLATGSDDAKVIIWEQKFRPKEFGSTETVFSWAEKFNLLGHSKEVYDVKWSLDSQWIFSASLDHSVIVWSSDKGKFIQRLEGHVGYVKGLCIDPLGYFVVSQSTDRSVRVYKTNKGSKNPNYSCRHHIKRMPIKKVEPDENSMCMDECINPVEEIEKYFKLFLDEN